MSDIKILLTNCKRKKISITAVSGDTLQVRAPEKVTMEQVLKVIEHHRDKINKMLQGKAIKDEKIEYINGSLIPYQGQELELCYVENANFAWRLDGKLYINKRYQKHTAIVLKDFYKTRATLLIKRCIELAKMHGFSPKQIKISSAEKRLGSCSTIGSINLSLYLMMATPQVSDYVIIHELVHLEHPNHSKAFWNRVQELVPDFRDHLKWLKSHPLRIREDKK